MSRGIGGLAFAVCVGVAACGRVPLDLAADSDGGAPTATGAVGTAGGGTGVVCGSRTCTRAQICCVLDGTCIDPATAAMTCPVPSVPPEKLPPMTHACGSNADCAANEFCSSLSSCLGPGFCADRDNCGTSWGAPFCGCDGFNYTNVQTACHDGVSTLGRVGVCGSVVDEPPMPGDVPHDPIINCGRDDQCPTGLTCCPIYGRCLDPAVPLLCTPPPAGASRPCLTDQQCDPGEFCNGDGCMGPGGCVRTSFSHGCAAGVLAPVCGCDGTLYTNADCAQAAGVRVRNKSSCTLQ
jgi:hypothetical protein